MKAPEPVLSPRQIAARRRALWQAMLALRGVGEYERFFIDLCTPAEIADMADRWAVACLLDRELPYRQIHDETGVSTATVTRVARSLHLGAGGYRAGLARLRGEER